VVLEADARRFADQMGIRFFETSAKENLNIEEMFNAITKLVLDAKLRSASQNSADRQQDHVRVGGKGDRRMGDARKTKCAKCG